MKTRHCFVVPAYGDSPHLSACLASLRAQTCESEILVSTSTPSEHISAEAAHYGVPVHVHSNGGGIGQDWNAALDAAPRSLVTLAHQDDCYDSNFTAESLATFETAPRCAMAFTEFDEIDADDKPISRSIYTRMKDLLVRSALCIDSTLTSKMARRVLLGFGNPIACASVTINRASAPDFRFRTDFRTNMDWVAWIELSSISGARRIPARLLHRRVHSSSETLKCIYSGAREAEDLRMFRLNWPEPLSVILANVYRLSYRAHK